MPGFGGFLEQVRKSFQAGAHIVDKEPTERVIVIEHRHELGRKINAIHCAHDERMWSVRFLRGRIEERPIKHTQCRFKLGIGMVRRREPLYDRFLQCIN